MKYILWVAFSIGKTFTFLERCFWNTTVDGRNPAPVDMENLPLFTGFYLSQVVQDFFHQQYHCQYLYFSRFHSTIIVCQYSLLRMAQIYLHTFTINYSTHLYYLTYNA